MPQTPEYTVRLRTPHEHQREKETPEPLTSAKASGKGMLPVWKRTSTASCSTSASFWIPHGIADTPWNACS
jgi:hypothetical protein